MTNLTERTIQTETIVNQGNNYIQPDIGINQIISAFCFIHVCLRQIYWLIYEVTNLSKCYFPYICVSPPDTYYSDYKIFLLSAFQQMKSWLSSSSQCLPHESGSSILRDHVHGVPDAVNSLLTNQIRILLRLCSASVFCCKYSSFNVRFMEFKTNLPITQKSANN